MDNKLLIAGAILALIGAGYLLSLRKPAPASETPRKSLGPPQGRLNHIFLNARDVGAMAQRILDLIATDQREVLTFFYTPPVFFELDDLEDLHADPAVSQAARNLHAYARQTLSIFNISSDCDDRGILFVPNTAPNRAVIADYYRRLLDLSTAAKDCLHPHATIAEDHQHGQRPFD
ncbi:hypothetical protein ACFSM5_17640 [Lacibacterium aquatile]|uniref:Uncharacterized protein n=1 Tax=Lacibacterium aquatile TaxID=1168082 RepID=A0ABW5DUB6_9PROT